MKTQQILMTAAAATTLFLSGCNSSGNSSSASIAGILTDSPVCGATYKCGAKVEVTDENGSFSCETLPVSFYVGGVKLGQLETVPADGNVTPQDLVGVPRDVYSEEVEKIAVFLQSLDDDGDINKTINLDQDIIAELERIHMEIHKMMKEEMIGLLKEIGAVGVVSEEEAIKHLRAHMPPCLDSNGTKPVGGREWGEEHRRKHHRDDVNGTHSHNPVMPHETEDVPDHNRTHVVPKPVAEEETQGDDVDPKFKEEQENNTPEKRPKVMPVPNSKED